MALIRKLTLLAALATIAAVPATAGKTAKRESLYTDISGKDCPGGDEMEIICPGPSDWLLDIVDEGNIIDVALYRKATPDAALKLTGRGLGEKAEWRGTRSKRGFRPDALIVRMRPVEDDETISSLLFIVKLQANGACLHGIVDAKVNADANMLARAGADKLPDSCEDYPRVYGKASAATALFGT
jgi:hypothetical protein